MFKLVHLYDLNIHKLVTKRDTQSLYQILQQFHQQQKKFTKKIHIILDNLHIFERRVKHYGQRMLCAVI
jgi:hypothetical protein